MKRWTYYCFPWILLQIERGSSRTNSLRIGIKYCDSFWTVQQWSIGQVLFSFENLWIERSQGFFNYNPTGQKSTHHTQQKWHNCLVANSRAHNRRRQYQNWCWIICSVKVFDYINVFLGLLCRGLPKAKDFRPKSKLSHLWISKVWRFF